MPPKLRPGPNRPDPTPEPGRAKGGGRAQKPPILRHRPGPALGAVLANLSLRVSLLFTCAEGSLPRCGDARSPESSRRAPLATPNGAAASMHRNLSNTGRRSSADPVFQPWACSGRRARPTRGCSSKLTPTLPGGCSGKPTPRILRCLTQADVQAPTPCHTTGVQRQAYTTNPGVQRQASTQLTGGAAASMHLPRSAAASVHSRGTRWCSQLPVVQATGRRLRSPPYDLLGPRQATLTSCLAVFPPP